MRSSVVASVNGKSFGSIEKLPPLKKSSTICCISVIIGCMSKKEMEKNLEYGDCFNIIGTFFGDILAVLGIEKKLDEKKKKT